MSQYKAVMDTGTSLIMGPTSLIDQIIDGIVVDKHCVGIDALPDITFTIGGIDYLFTARDYIVEID